MDETLFSIYKKQLEAEGIDANTKASRDWFLDKIQEMGIDSLTNFEKQILDEYAKD